MPKKGGANKNNSLFNNNKSSFENNVSAPIGNELNVKLNNKLNNNNLVGKINNKSPNTNNSVVSSKKGKYTTIIVIVVVFTILAILSYVAYRYINYKSINKVVTKEIIPFIYDSKKTSRYSYGSLPVSTERNSYNYNMWIYINDYDYRVGEDKCVLMKGYTANNDDQVNPGIYLLKNTNTLRVKITLETLYKYAECNNDAGISDTVKEALQDNNYYLGSESSNNYKPLNPESIPESIPESNSDNTKEGEVIDNFTNYTNDELYDYCDIKFFPMQKWVSLNVGLTNNILNISIDGKLVKTCSLKGAPKIINRDLMVSPGGGFNGFLSNLKVSSKELSPEAILDLYKDGPRLKTAFLS